MKILVINPGSTSTKMAVYENESPILLRNISHSAEDLAPFGNITEQQDFRRQLVLDESSPSVVVSMKSISACWMTHYMDVSCTAMPAIWDV